MSDISYRAISLATGVLVGVITGMVLLGVFCVAFIAGKALFR
jgi:hypothetical protein